MPKFLRWTTVGRFWGYVGVFLALGTSLAGNVESAKLHTPFIDPTRTEIAFAGLPPLVAFVSIELVNHNPWANIAWGKWITRVLLFVVAPGSALVSFVHLTLVGLHSLQVPIPADMQQYLNVATAVLTALLIDGLILGGTAALLLPVRTVTVIEHGNRGHALPSGLEKLRDEMQAEFDAQRAQLVAAIEHLQNERRETRKAKAPAKRVPAARPSHPAWDQWVQFQAREGREPTGREMAEMAGVSPGAARSLMSRWRKVSTSA